MQTEITARKPLAVRRSRDLGPQFVDNPHRMVGQDGAYSFPVDAGSFWFFGDTLIGRRVEGQSLWLVDNQIAGPGDLGGRGTFEAMPNNTALLLSCMEARDGLKDFQYLLGPDGRIRQVIERLPDEHPDHYRIWCLHGCQLGSRVHIFYQKIHMVKEGPFPVNFEVVGVGQATGRVGEWRFERLVQRGSTVWWGGEFPQFGAAVLPVREKNLAYLYGVRKAADGTQNASVARVRLDALTDLAAYEYLAAAGPTWSRDPAESVTLFVGPPNELSVSFNPYLGQYLAVHSMNLSGLIVGRTSPDPWGPWSDAIPLWRVHPTRTPLTGFPNMIYAAKEHAELSREGGRIVYVTFIEFEEYYPHLIELELE